MNSDIHKFPLAWRWTNPKYTVFPGFILNQLIPLDKNAASEIDSKVRVFFNGPKLKRNLLHSWQRHDAENPCSSFLEGLAIRGDSSIFLSWDIYTALKTNWSVFKNHWNDFCYPASDDLAIYAVDGSWLLAYFHYEIFEFGEIK